MVAHVTADSTCVGPSSIDVRVNVDDGKIALAHASGGDGLVRPADIDLVRLAG
jgi:hypothetical protein